MKKQIVLALAVAGISASATVVFAGSTPGTGINGSMHDINSVPGYTGDTFARTCVFCHTPHNARTTDLLVPLWNHADATTPSLPAYNWVAPLNKAISINSDPLIGPTRLCMACHDGNTAVDSHGSAGSIPTGSHKMTQVASYSYTDALGKNIYRSIPDLTITHPIGFSYAEAVTKRNLKSDGTAQDKAELIEATNGFILNATSIVADAANWDTSPNSASRIAAGQTSKKIQDTLYGTAGYMTCATCHEVHNTLNAAPLGLTGTTSYNYFLYAQEEGSAICLSCHVK